MNRKIHLTNNTLDGYTSQYLTRGLGYTHMVATEGASLDSTLNKIMSLTEVDEILITDISLSLQQMSQIDEHCIDDNDIKLHLIDNTCLSIYRWHHTDNNISSGMMTYKYLEEHFKEHFGEYNGNPPAYLDMINSFLIGKKDSHYEYGMIINDYLNRYIGDDIFHFNAYYRTKAFQLLNIVSTMEFDYESNDYRLFEERIDSTLKDFNAHLSSVRYNVNMQRRFFNNRQYFTTHTSPSESYRGMLLLAEDDNLWSLLTDYIIDDAKLDFIIRINKAGVVTVRTIGDVSAIIITNLICGEVIGTYNDATSFNTDLSYISANEDSLTEVLEKIAPPLGLAIDDLVVFADSDTCGWMKLDNCK